MAGGERDDAIRPAVEKRIALDQQRSGALLDESRKCVVDVAVVTGIKYENLLARRAGSGLQVFRIRFSNRVLRIDEKSDQHSRGNHLLQQLQLLWRERIGEDRHAGEMAVRPVQALDEPELDRIGAREKNDWYCRGCRLGREPGGDAAGSSDDRHSAGRQIGRQHRQAIVVTLRPAEFDRHIAPYDVTGFAEARAKGTDEGRRVLWRPTA